MISWLRRRSRPGPKTDMQSRLRVIELRAKQLQARNRDNPDIHELGYLVEYLTLIVEKHLQTGER